MNKYRNKNLKIKQTNEVLPEEVVEKGKALRDRVWIKYILPVLYITLLLLPVAVFFRDRGGLSMLDSQVTADYFKKLYPLFGLLAFSSISSMILMASNLWWLEKIWPNIKKLYSFQALVTLFIVAFHPLLIAAGYGLSNYINLEFVSPNQSKYLITGVLGLCLLLAYLLATVLVWKKILVPFYFYVHKLVYIAFPLVWLHSWFIGSDTESGGLRGYWVAVLVLVLASISIHWWYKAYRAPIYVKPASK